MTSTLRHADGQHTRSLVVPSRSLMAISPILRETEREAFVCEKLWSTSFSIHTQFNSIHEVFWAWILRNGMLDLSGCLLCGMIKVCKNNFQKYFELSNLTTAMKNLLSFFIQIKAAIFSNLFAVFFSTHPNTTHHIKASPRKQ